MSDCSDQTMFKLLGNGKVGDAVEVASGTRDPSVTRVRSDLKLRSVDRISSSQRVRGLSCTTDGDGNVYVLGQYFESMFADNIYLTTPDSGIFLAQMGSDGKWKWATTIHAHTSANDITMSCQVTYRQKYLYSAMVIRNPGTQNTEGFVIKTDRGGNVSYTTRFTGDLSNHIRIDVDRNGNAYIVNSYRGNLTLTNSIKLPKTAVTISQTTQTPLNPNRGYVAKIGKNGIWIWARDISGCYDIDGSSLNDIVTKPNGNSYVVGSFNGTVILDDMVIKGSRDLAVQDFIMAEIGSGGFWIRAEACPGAVGMGIDMDTYKNLYVTGTFHHKIKFFGSCVESYGGTNLFVARVDKFWNAEWVVSTKFNNNQVSNNLDIIVDNDNNTYVDGVFDRPLVMGGKTLVPRGSNDQFIAKLSPNGSWLWSEQISGNDLSSSKDLALGVTGGLYTTGGFNKELIVGEKCTIDSHTEFAPGICTLYLLRYQPSLPKLIGVISKVISKKNMVSIVFKGPTKAIGKLEPGQNYYVDNAGDISSDPRYQYLGTALSRDTLLIQ